MSTTVENYYSVLGVVPSADRDGIRRQYRRMARALHPDRCPTTEQKDRATAAMARISLAYSILHDPQRRAEHDEALIRWTPTAREQRAQVLMHVTTALAEVVGRADDPSGIEQVMINRLLQDASRHISGALALVEGKVSVLEGSTHVAAFLALAKGFTSYANALPDGEVPAAAYNTLMRETAYECVRGLTWESRLSWPEPTI
ncbi:J domain-containing protein [Kineosporia sp. J2-2]|uniref:J domain-containing protein n=1 Tax=Kineosporia corallincola TaxID=2835133 RepID=A0ABS5TRR0_9ACTN|nr:J domain-containing protein [Kineosporia corallincola]MBT0773487.1 J domain-containing protein [Kineosporia corallincola]